MLICFEFISGGKESLLFNEMISYLLSNRSSVSYICTDITLFSFIVDQFVSLLLTIEVDLFCSLNFIKYYDNKNRIISINTYDIWERFKQKFSLEHTCNSMSLKFEWNVQST